MARVKSPAIIKHRKLRAETKGMRQARRTRVKAGREALLHAGQYAYVGRRLRKRDLRSLWIIRLSIAAKDNGTSYSKLIKKLKENNVEIDRKILSDIAVQDPNAFKSILSQLK